MKSNVSKQGKYQTTVDQSHTPTQTILQGVVLKLPETGILLKRVAKNNYWELDVHIDKIYRLDTPSHYHALTFL